MDEWEGNDFDAIEYLYSQGYRLTNRWNWLPAENHTVLQEDYVAMNYLFDEWDWGWLIEELEPGEFIVEPKT